MNRIFFYMMAAVVLTTACKKDKDIPKMTMCSQKMGVLNIYLAGTSKITIDWGDGSKIETHSLSAFVTVLDDKYRYSHHYGSASARTITITGENITHFDCRENELTSLDVCKNTALTVLICGNNQLRELDVSNNTALTYLGCWVNQIASIDVSSHIELEFLYCGSNLLTSLDVTNNSKLRILICDDNQLNNLDVKGCSMLTNLNCGKFVYTPVGLGNHLTSLDVNGCTSLINLNCENNLLSAKSLNDLFETLHDKTFASGKQIYISHNPGTIDCSKSIAEIKGWDVY